MESTGMEFIRALYWHLPEGTKPHLVSQVTGLPPQMLKFDPRAVHV